MLCLLLNQWVVTSLPDPVHQGLNVVVLIKAFTIAIVFTCTKMEANLYQYKTHSIWSICSYAADMLQLHVNLNYDFSALFWLIFCQVFFQNLSQNSKEKLQSRPIEMRATILYLAYRWTEFEMLLTTNWNLSVIFCMKIVRSCECIHHVSIVGSFPTPLLSWILSSNRK